MSKIVSKNRQERKIEHGFAFVMIAIMTMFIGIVVYGTILQTTSSKSLNKVKLTKEKMQKIEDALHDFVLENKYLPCPSSLILSQDNADYGVDKRVDTLTVCDASILDGVFASTSGDLLYGAVPTRTLGLKDDAGIDDWGSKIVYVIDANFTIATTEDNDAGFTFYISEDVGTGDDGEISVDSNYYVYLILSHGRDKDGAYSAKSTTRSTVINTNTLDASDTFDVTFDHVSNDILLLGSENKLKDLVVVVEEGSGEQEDKQTGCVCPSHSKVIETITMQFPPVKCGQRSYGDNVCPSDVNDSSPSGDYYYMSKNDEEKPYLECKTGKSWSDSDIVGPCELLPECDSPKTQQSGLYTINWVETTPYVYTRTITGTYVNNETVVTIHGVCNVSVKNTDDITNSTMEWIYY